MKSATVLIVTACLVGTGMPLTAQDRTVWTPAPIARAITHQAAKLAEHPGSTSLQAAQPSRESRVARYVALGAGIGAAGGMIWGASCSTCRNAGANPVYAGGVLGAGIGAGVGAIVALASR
jgi:hypothetical protein